jgi:hypothetical protein
MPDYVLYAAWPALALLLYLLVTCVLSVLAKHRYYAVSLHDVVRESKLKRNAYIKSTMDSEDEDILV